MMMMMIFTYTASITNKKNKTTLHTSRYTLAPSADTTVTPSLLPPKSSRYGRVRSLGDQL